MMHRFTDTTRPGIYLDVDLEREDEDDDFEVDEEQAVQILDWWSDPVGRGYTLAEDGGRIAVVQVSDGGEPPIEWWSQETNDYSWPLESFPFRTLEYTEVPE